MTNISFPVLLNRSQVLDRIGMKPTQLYKNMKDGLFPRPIRIGKRAVRWRETDLIAWLERCPVSTGEVGEKISAA